MIEISQSEYNKLAELIKKNYGINLGSKKQVLLMGRLQNVLADNGFNSFSEYYNYIVSDKTGKAVNTLINKISTNHTFFMREPDHFMYFKDNILPWMKRVAKDRDFRIWSAGCSSGEEPYTIAMLIDEFLGLEKGKWDTKVLATDISSAALERALTGEYTKEAIELLPPLWVNNYFKKANAEKYVVTEQIRKQVIFRRLNLMINVFPFKRKFHTIFCRNVMIYFDENTKQNLINKFYDMLEDGGYLIIGHSESINRNSSKLKYVIPALYRKE